MARITIPENHLSGFIAIGDLKEKEFKQVLELVEVGLDKEKTPRIESIISWIQNIEESEVRQSLEALMGLISFRYRQSNSSDVFFEDFYASLKDQLEEKEYKHSQKAIERVKQLYNQAVAVRRSLKASNLLYESEHVYDSCRVISDIRPLFDDEDPSLKCEHAIIIHRLKLARRDADGQKELYVSLTRSQLLEIKQHIDRALEKEDQMKETAVFSFIDQ